MRMDFRDTGFVVDDKFFHLLRSHVGKVRNGRLLPYPSNVLR